MILDEDEDEDEGKDVFCEGGNKEQTQSRRPRQTRGRQDRSRQQLRQYEYLFFSY